MPRNIEWKARLADFDIARRIAVELATDSLGVEQQLDTYFACPRGRLKLREIKGRASQLVWYQRADVPEAKASDYILAGVADAEAMKEALSGALGILGVVGKKREIYLYHNVRIHLDRVRNLGDFLEFEAVLSPEHDDRECERLVKFLAEAFEASIAEVVAGSYFDLLYPS